MLAVAFFALVGLIIVAGIAYGIGHADGMAEGYEQGQAATVDREVEAAIVLWSRSQRVVPCQPPPFDWAAMEREVGRR